MATIQSIFDRVTFVTKDYDHERWTLAELAKWLNDAQDQIASLHPRAAARYQTLTLAEGAIQSLTTSGGSVRWMRLYEIICNVVSGQPTGSIIRQVARSSLDIGKNWRGASPSSTIKEYTLDERTPLNFEVNPPAIAGTQVHALVAIKPPVCAALNLAGTALAVPTEEFALAPGFDIPAVDYVLFRCFSKDANDPTYSSRAGGHLQAFQLAMQVETKDASAA